MGSGSLEEVADGHLTESERSQHQGAVVGGVETPPRVGQVPHYSARLELKRLGDCRGRCSPNELEEHRSLWLSEGLPPEVLSEFAHNDSVDGWVYQWGSHSSVSYWTPGT